MCSVSEKCDFGFLYVENQQLQREGANNLRSEFINAIRLNTMPKQKIYLIITKFLANGKDKERI